MKAVIFTLGLVLFGVAFAAGPQSYKGHVYRVGENSEKIATARCSLMLQKTGRGDIAATVGMQRSVVDSTTNFFGLQVVGSQLTNCGPEQVEKTCLSVQLSNSEETGLVAVQFDVKERRLNYSTGVEELRTVESCEQLTLSN